MRPLVSDFRQHLQAELARRCAANPRYSLRAFAKMLHVNHSTLSQILRGKRPLTRQTIERLGPRLKLSPEAVMRFVARLRRPSHPDGAIREATLLAHDTACAISEWHHHAILELLRLPEFQTDSRWIARVLDLRVDEVNMALQRLLRLGMLEMRDRDQWVDRSGNDSQTDRAFAFAALRRMFDRLERLVKLADSTKENRNGQARDAVADPGKGPGKARRVLREDV
jgi:transcriptional regulator with XRE-family HTH domain